MLGWHSDGWIFHDSPLQIKKNDIPFPTNNKMSLALLLGAEFRDLHHALTLSCLSLRRSCACSHNYMSASWIIFPAAICLKADSRVWGSRKEYVSLRWWYFRVQRIYIWYILQRSISISHPKRITLIIKIKSLEYR